MKDVQFDICIVGLKCYDSLKGVPVPKYLGGIEKVLVGLAKAMVSQGLRVAFITYDEGQPDSEQVEGVTIFKAHKADEGIRGLRFVHPRMTAVWKAMKKARASVYLQMGAGVETAVTAFGARYILSPNAKFIYCLSSDRDCSIKGGQLSFAHRVERVFYRWGLRMADVVVSQTSRQKQLLRESFAIDSTVITMPYEPGAAVQRNSFEEVPEVVNIIWVGRIVEIKRLELLLDMAEKNPGYQFHVAGSANKTSEYAMKVLGRAEQISNVHIHGRVSDQKLQQLYQEAYVLCCTSSLEGFPTTFLEAWSRGLPVLTTFDPDSIVQKNKLGKFVQNPVDLNELLQQLVNDRNLYRKISDDAVQYYQDHFTAAAVVPKYMEVFEL